MLGVEVNDCFIVDGERNLRRRSLTAYSGLEVCGHKGEYTLRLQQFGVINSLKGSFQSTSRTRQADGNPLLARLPNKSPGDSSSTCLCTMKFRIITFFGSEPVL